MIYKSLLFSVLLLCLSASGSLAQSNDLLPSIAIRTDSEMDSLIFRVRMDGTKRFKVYFEERLNADLPPFQEKYFALRPQRKWSCVGMRETAEALEIIILEDCEKGRQMGLENLYEASDLPRKWITGWSSFITTEPASRFCCNE